MRQVFHLPPAALGGWKKTTTNGLTGTKQNAADTSTTPTTITATVDAVNIFGQTVPSDCLDHPLLPNKAIFATPSPHC